MCKNVSERPPRRLVQARSKVGLGSDRMDRSKLLITNKKWVKRETEHSVWYVGRTQETLVMSDLKEWGGGVKPNFML